MSLIYTEPSAGPSQNIVSHIRHLLPLPRHAVFHVRLVVHQLSNVPLISGQFRIKWKFCNLQAVNSAGRPLGLGRVLARKLEKHNAKGKEVVRSEHYDERGEYHEQGPDGRENELFMSSEGTSTLYGRPASSYSSGMSSNSKISSFEAPAPSESIDYQPEARGFTPFLPLRDFKVVFAHQIDVAVQMSIDKESLTLLPSELKLTVMQRVVQGDPDSPLNPRLGHVQVNLAEYADAGPITRNYLLRRSKVNAMLNMTITMTQISGEANYRAPPLRKEEIGAGIAHFLASTEALPQLSRFSPTEDPWLVDSLDLFLPQQEDSPPPDSPPPESVEPPAPAKKRWRSAKRSTSEDLSDPPPPKPIQRERLNATEALIEAIFNPYPTTSTTPSPFTYYVPPMPQQASDGTGTDGTSRSSFESSPQASASASASEQGCEAASGAGNNSRGSTRGSKWWHTKTGTGTYNGPITPARSNSTRS